MIDGKRMIALCISRLFDQENARFITELNQFLRPHDCSLWIYNINTDLYWEEDAVASNAEVAVFDLIDYERTDAVIIMDEKIKSRTVADSIIRKALAHGIPTILTDGTHDGCSEVRFDYAGGFERVMRHVLEFHTVHRPHFMGGIPDNPFSLEREAVFRRLVEEYGIPFSKDMVSYGYFWSKPAQAATEELLRRDVLPDVIFCANDVMAINAASVLQAHGLRIPEDILITGFDGIDEIGYTTPTITSALCGTSGMSESVFHAVMDALTPGSTPKHYKVRPRLLRNHSCGCQFCDSADRNRTYTFNDRFYRYQDDNRLLSDMCERMQTFDSIEDSCYSLFGSVLTDMCCIINQSCTDFTTDYFASQREKPFDDEMLLFLDTDQIPFAQRSFLRRDVIPDLETVMAHGYPLIFNALSFMNHPMGYLCFHFRGYEVMEYCKISHIVSCLSLGLGGFINRQYQSYLTQRIELMYRLDPLTGLCNRLSFSRDFEALCQSKGDQELPLTVLLSDLDGLKTINDRFGHAAGDHAIHTVAAALLSACPPDALSVRFGGDEMVAVIPGECDGNTIRQQILDYLAAYNAGSDLPYRIDSSIGVTHTTLTSDTDFEALLKRADASMYTIKQQKKAKRV